jgi:hypothetical protein
MRLLFIFILYLFFLSSFNVYGESPSTTCLEARKHIEADSSVTIIHTSAVGYNGCYIAFITKPFTKEHTVLATYIYKFQHWEYYFYPETFNLEIKNEKVF